MRSSTPGGVSRRRSPSAASLNSFTGSFLTVAAGLLLFAIFFLRERGDTVAPARGAGIALVWVSASSADVGKRGLEAFSDGVIADHHHDHGAGAEGCLTALTARRSVPLDAEVPDLRAELHLPRHLLEQSSPSLLHAVRRVTGGILWANLHLLFWLSLVPFATGWMGENRFRAAPHGSTAWCSSTRPGFAHYVLMAT